MLHHTTTLATAPSGWASRFGMSEGEWLATHVRPAAGPGARGMTAQRLRPLWPQMATALASAGQVIALTRNESCVIEQVGTYARSHHADLGGQATGHAINLFPDYPHWAHGFAVDLPTDKGLQRSLQFFDAAGTAIHKVFLCADTDPDTWLAVVGAFLSPDQQPGITAEPPRVSDPERADARIDVPAFRQAWASMRDTPAFLGLLKRHGVTRAQAMRLADPMFVQRVDSDAAYLALNAAARDGIPVSMVVGNPAMTQALQGPVTKAIGGAQWLNVLGAGFSVHLRADHIASAWVAGMPTGDGLVTTLELFDAQGATIATVCGERQPGRPETMPWRSLITAVARETTPCTA